MAALLVACAGTPPQAIVRPVETATASSAIPPAVPPAPVKTVAVDTPPAPRVLPKLGLALGGGAARGFAHIGVIQVLEEAGLRPDFVAGTSAGSVVAALYASGKTGAQLQQIGESMEEAAISDWTLPVFNSGILRGDALAKYVNQQVGGRSIETMTVPLGIVATDLYSGDMVVFQRGDTGMAVRASSAVPAIFQPVKIAGRSYVDGGLVSPVPVRAARSMGAQVVLAIDISSPPDSSGTDGTIAVLLQTASIMGKSINGFELKEADVVVRPDLRAVSSADFSSRKKAIEAGRRAMLDLLPQLRAAILAKTH
jgi:NTE family protein